MSRDLLGVPIFLYEGQGHLSVLHELYALKHQDHSAGHFYDTGDTNHLTELEPHVLPLEVRAFPLQALMD